MTWAKGIKMDHRANGPEAVVKFDELLLQNDDTHTYRGFPFSGIAVEYFADGARSCEQRFCDGHPDGITRVWFPDGRLKSEGTFRGDGINGIFQEWYPNGQLKTKVTAEFGILIEEYEWDESGRLVKEYKIPATGVSQDLLAMKRAARDAFEGRETNHSFGGSG